MNDAPSSLDGRPKRVTAAFLRLYPSATYCTLNTPLSSTNDVYGHLTNVRTAGKLAIANAFCLFLQSDASSLLRPDCT